VSKYISALAIKDVKWERAANGRWRAEFVPVGEGMIDLKRLFTLLKEKGFAGPVNIHYEHNSLLGTDLGTWKLDISRERFIELVGNDLRAVRAAMT
jgi:sugar phosphate isomerase/epimerase